MLRDNPLFIRFCPKNIKLQLMKVLGTLYLNSAQANLKIEDY